MMWIVAKLGFFVWVLRQLLRYSVFHWMTKLRKAISYSQPNSTPPVTNHGVGVGESSSNVTIISRREIPRHGGNRFGGKGRSGYSANECYDDFARADRAASTLGRWRGTSRHARVALVRFRDDIAIAMKIMKIQSRKVDCRKVSVP
jgi:hypothetical protein